MRFEGKPVPFRFRLKPKLYEILRASARTTNDERRAIMIKSRHGTVLTTCYCTCIVLALIFLHGCSGAAKIESTEPVTRITTETTEVECRYVLNPETGELEKLPVHKTQTIVTQTPSETIEEEWEYVPNPKTGELEKFLVRETHTTVTQTSSVKTSEEGGMNRKKLTEYLDLISSGLDVILNILYLTSK